MMPKMTKPAAVALAGMLLVFALAGTAMAQDQDDASSLLPDYRIDNLGPTFSVENDPVLPWIPAEHMNDRDDAMRYWNAYYRGGRFQYGVTTNYTTFEAVSSPESGQSPDASVGGADTADLHITLDLGIVLYESIRLAVGVGTTLHNFQDAARNGAGHDRYGFGVHYSAELSWAPVLVFLPDMVLPELSVYIRGTTAKNLNGGVMNTTYVRISARIYVELAKSDDLSLSLFVGGGYQFFEGYLNTAKFNWAAGEAAKIFLPDLGFNAGLMVFFGKNFGVRVEANNLPSIALSLEIITD